ncbi:MAG: two-component sensor histidine kinase [Proteobacteria bacterium]|nr:MAG: two-component sensor histidine kinase [Pseudomonadota bacterium]
MLNLSRFKPRFWDHRDAAAGPEDPPFNFRRKWLVIVVFMTLVTLTPLSIMALVDYRLTRQAAEAQFRAETLRTVSNIRRRISFALTQRHAVLAFIARDNTLPALLAPGRLETILDHLRSRSEDVLALEVKDAGGTSLAYAGPHGPAPKNGVSETDFDQTAVNGFFLGDISTGEDRKYRLVMALRHKPDSGDAFILRATLEADFMNAPVEQLTLDDGADAFIVNTRGILQTTTRHHGNRLDQAPLAIPGGSADTRVLAAMDDNGQPILMGIARIADSPFTVVTTRLQAGIGESWLTPRLHLIGFLSFSMAMIIVAILGVATYLVNRIYGADRRRVEALHQVEYANKMASIGRLASGVAHEVNNPLAIINQKAGLIKDLLTIRSDYTGDEKLLGLLDDVLASVQRGGAITRRLLDFARHMDTSVETVDIEAVIRQILAFMEKEAQRRRIVVNIAIRDRIPAFQSDRGNLQQIFLNLVNNAFAAMEDGGHLNIVIRRQGTGHILVSVSDTGHGIAQADLKRVFEPFFSTRRGHAGTGLGLSITYGMVSEMGGRITVDSQVNQGTTFSVVLPLHPPGQSSAKACDIAPRHASEIVPGSKTDREIP